MTRAHPFLALATALATAGAAAAADTDAYTRTVEGSFADVAFSVEQAIVSEGLVIDFTSHVGEMLERTREDVGGTTQLFTAADSFSFCSAQVSRQVMEAAIANIQFCPYAVFLYETPDKPGSVTVGHRVYPGETMAPVNTLLNRIVDTATN